MARLVVVDTDVLIDYLRGRGPGADLVEGLLREGSFLTTAITHFELVQGVSRANERARIAPLLSLECLSLTAESSARAGDLARDLRGRGESLATADILQAGICLHYGLPLATRNLRHFERIPGLELRVPG